MTEPLSPERALRQAKQLAADLEFAERAGHAEESKKLLRDAYTRLVERVGYDPLA